VVPAWPQLPVELRFTGRSVLKLQDPRGLSRPGSLA
jgi:hypothetical protein